MAGKRSFDVEVAQAIFAVLKGCDLFMQQLQLQREKPGKTELLVLARFPNVSMEDISVHRDMLSGLLDINKDNAHCGVSTCE